MQGTEKPVLSVCYKEGPSGCLAVCEELDLEIGAPTRESAEYGITHLLLDHCRALVRRNGTGGGPLDTLALAERVIKEGYALQERSS